MRVGNSQGHVLVVGSAKVDISVTARELPLPEQTVVGDSSVIRVALIESHSALATSSRLEPLLPSLMSLQHQVLPAQSVLLESSKIAVARYPSTAI